MRLFFVFFISFVVQTLWPTPLSAWGIAPNFILILTVVVALQRGALWGQLVGFFSGLVVDTVGLELFGSTAIMLAIVGYVSGMTRRQWDHEQPSAQMLLVLGASWAYFLGGILLRLLFVEVPKPAGFREWLIIPMVNMVIAPLVFAIFRAVSKSPYYLRGTHVE